ncbi:MAG: hypothetical protein V1809_05550 [Planctomycetota bacterium]
MSREDVGGAEESISAPYFFPEAWHFRRAGRRDGKMFGMTVVIPDLPAGRPVRIMWR